MACAGVGSYSSAWNLDSLCLGALDEPPCRCSDAHCALCMRTAASQNEDVWLPLLISKSHQCCARWCSNRSTCALAGGF